MEIEEVKPNLFIQKTKFGYKVVYPIKKDLTKPLSFDNINWKNLLIGSWKTFGIFLLILFFLFLLYKAYYKEVVIPCKEIMENPCEYCMLSSPFSSFLPDSETLEFSNTPNTSQELSNLLTIYELFPSLFNSTLFRYVPVVIENKTTGYYDLVKRMSIPIKRRK